MKPTKILIFLILALPIFSNATIERTSVYLLQVASNQTHDRHYEITQKELQETLRFLHVDQVSMIDINRLKTSYKSNEHYQSLDLSTQIEIQKLLTDLADTQERMDEWKQKGLWCRFALRDDPWEEVSENSFLKNPEAYWGFMPDDEVRKTIQSRYERAAIAQCYSSIENDYLYRIGIDPITLKARPQARQYSTNYADINK